MALGGLEIKAPDRVEIDGPPGGEIGVPLYSTGAVWERSGHRGWGRRGRHHRGWAGIGHHRGRSTRICPEVSVEPSLGTVVGSTHLVGR